MDDDDWVKELLMLPARAHIASVVSEERRKHARRSQLGDSAKRSSCCGPRPDSFPEGMTVEQIVELKSILERTSTIQMGYCPFYCCKVCGQEWFQDFEPAKFGGNVYVRKVT